MSGSTGSELVLGVDVGGTFTDAVLIDRSTGEIRHTKVPSTPHDQSEGTLATMPALDVDPQSLATFNHGSTVGLNAYLERRGSKTALLCTEGTRDTLDIGRLRRNFADGLYDPTWRRPHQDRPLVHRRYIRELQGRRLSDGSQHVPLDEDAIRAELEFLRDEGIESVAICLVNSFVNLEDEERIVELVRECLPDAYVQYSAVRPVVGEYVRTMAVVTDAYVGPKISSYLGNLDSQLREREYTGPTAIMQMNGGMRTLERTRERQPANALASGPVAGLLGAEFYGPELSGEKNLVCMDIGGTSTDIGLIVDGRAQLIDEWDLEFQMPLGFPAIDVRSVGAGGGSLIQVDGMGTLRVGPESSGAMPGPACYGRGGQQPTITDAHVVLGRIRPETFLGGRMPLDVDAANAVISDLARKLEMDPYVLAEGAITMMAASIESEISKLLFANAVDVRDFALFSYGGAGAFHAWDVAVAAGIGEVIVPNFADSFSALGLSLAPVKAQEAVSEIVELSAVDVDRVADILGGLERRAVADLEAQGIRAEDATVERSIYAMYAGQSNDNEVAIDWPITPEALERFEARFHEMYDRLYGYSAPELDITLTTFSVTATGTRPEFRLPKAELGGEEPADEALTGRFPAYFDGARVPEVPFYSKASLVAGNKVRGPAVIDAALTTIVVPPGVDAQVDAIGNIRLRERI